MMALLPWHAVAVNPSGSVAVGLAWVVTFMDALAASLLGHAGVSVYDID
jgi:hypothetical protein